MHYALTRLSYNADFFAHGYAFIEAANWVSNFKLLDFFNMENIQNGLNILSPFFAWQFSIMISIGFGY